MNERIKELAEQAGIGALFEHNWGYDEELKRFAELVRQDERQALAQPEQDKQCKHCGGKGCVACDARCLPKQWVGLTDEEIKGILDCGRGGLVDIKKAEQILKDKNGG